MTLDEIALMREVLRWGRQAGWRRRRPHIYSWAGGAVEVHTVRGCVCVARRRTGAVFITPVSLTETISLLAVMRVVPAKFSGLGREALADHAEVCRRFAKHAAEQHPHQQGDDLDSWRMYAAGLLCAAEIAETTP